MWDYRRQLGTFAVIGLVLLRLAIGWHFYREGSAKLIFDKQAERFDVAFSAEGFLSQAKGPLAELYQSFVPNGHDWQAMLAVDRQDKPLTEEDASADADWQRDYNARRAAATEKNQQPPIEFAPSAPYGRWATRVADDWKVMFDKAAAVPGVTDNERRALAEALAARQNQLADYLATQAEVIADYQHELWRLKNLRSRPEAGGVPFVEQQVISETAKTNREPLAWVREVNDIEAVYVDDLRAVFAAKGEANEAAVAAADEVLVPSQPKQLRTISMAVTVLTIGVGICLLAGFFTRLAAVAGALFLLSVIASQPPWVTGAADTYYQTVELAGLLVLAGTGAGRWAGLDYFGYAFCSRFCGRGKAAKS